MTFEGGTHTAVCAICQHARYRPFVSRYKTGGKCTQSVQRVFSLLKGLVQEQRAVFCRCGVLTQLYISGPFLYFSNHIRLLRKPAIFKVYKQEHINNAFNMKLRSQWPSLSRPQRRPTYDLERVQFQRCSMEATTIRRVNFSGSQSGKNRDWIFRHVFLLRKVTSRCKQEALRRPIWSK